MLYNSLIDRRGFVTEEQQVSYGATNPTVRPAFSLCQLTDFIADRARPTNN